MITIRERLRELLLEHRTALGHRGRHPLVVETTRSVYFRFEAEQQIAEWIAWSISRLKKFSSCGSSLFMR